jgi:hypothetical protein
MPITPSNFKIWHISLYIMILILLPGGCLYLITFDHTDKIAKVMLTNSKGGFDVDVFNAGLTKKIPIGSTSNSAITFVKNLGGFCTQNSAKKTLECSIPRSGSFCVKDDIYVVIQVDIRNKVLATNAIMSGGGC